MWFKIKYLLLINRKQAVPWGGGLGVNGKKQVKIFLLCPIHRFLLILLVETLGVSTLFDS